MGVIRQPRKVVIATTNSTDTEGNTTNTSTDDEAPQAPPASVPAPPLHRPAAPSSPGLARAKLGQKHRMKQGRRSQQRAENDRLLMAMYGIDSEEAVQGGDIQQETRSYFVDLLDAENQELLDQFLNNQEAKFLRKETEGPRKVFANGEGEFQPDEAFMKMGFNMRLALKKHVPLGMLQGIEDNIVGSFVQDPHGEYIAEDFSSFERLILHALCSYNALNSYSYDSNGKRKVKVGNPCKEFNKKDPSLYQYLLGKQKR